MVISGSAEVLAPAEKVKRPRAVLPEVRLHDAGARYRQLIERTRGLPPIRTARRPPGRSRTRCGARSTPPRPGLIVPVLVGPEAKIRAAAEAAGVDLSPYELVPDRAQPRGGRARRWPWPAPARSRP